MRWDVHRRADELRRAGQSFVLATVVRVERPASTHPGDRALVTPEGTVEGWVGGACAEGIVVREALQALAQGTPRLVRIGPPETQPPAGVVSAVSTCPSGGTVEVFLEPVRPDPHLVVFGESLVARTLVRLAHTVGYRVTAVVAEERRAPEADAVYVFHLPPGVTATEDGMVVATMGHWDEDAVGEALRTPASYVALVASRRRAAAVLDSLRRRGLDEESLRRVSAPAGLDFGSASQEEIALAVLADYAARRRDSRRAAPEVAPEVATDPVCGMAVAVTGARFTLEHLGRIYYFCSPGCRKSFSLDPTSFLADAVEP